MAARLSCCECSKGRSLGSCCRVPAATRLGPCGQGGRTGRPGQAPQLRASAQPAGPGCRALRPEASNPSSALPGSWDLLLSRAQVSTGRWRNEVLRGLGVCPVA